MALRKIQYFEHKPKPSDSWDARAWAFKTPKERKTDEDNLEKYLMGYLKKLTGSLQREYEPVMPVAVGKRGHHRGSREKKGLQ